MSGAAAGRPGLFAAAATRAEAIRTEAADALAKSIGIKPADIKRLGKSTVYI